MSQFLKPVVIVGAGQAGGWVAATIRQHQPKRPIILIGDENHPPYERPPLSKDVLLGKATPESTYIRPLAYYAENDIQLRLETPVAAIHPDAGCVELAGGEMIAYDRLVLATGMRARRLDLPGADHARVRSLRNMADLQAIQQELQPGRRIVCVGAGFIGLEMAAVAAQAGCDVQVIEAAPGALGRIVAPEVASAIVLRHEAKGVRFHFGVSLKSIEDSAGRPILCLAGGERIAADLVLVGIGGQPNDELARAAGLDCDGGIRVDATGRSSRPEIYAAGDVTRQDNLALGRVIRLESWQNAQNQGIMVGGQIAGVSQPYTDLPWFWTDQYEHNFQIIGAPERWDQLIWRGAPGDDKFTVVYVADNRVVAGNTMNNTRDIRALRQLISSGTPVSEALLSDMSLSLTKIQKLQVI